MQFIWVLTAVLCVIAGMVLLFSLMGSAIQVAAGAAVASAICVIAYVLARSIEGISRPPKSPGA